MEILAFIVAMTKALAWPAGAVIIAVLLRAPIRKLLEKARIESFKIGPGGLEATLKHAEEQIEELPAPDVRQLPAPKPELPPGAPPPTKVPSELTAPEVPASPEPRDVEKDLAQYVPAGAIVAGWAQLETTIKSAALRFYPAERDLPLSACIDALEKNEVISPAITDAIKAMRNVRDGVAHGATEVSADLVARYLRSRDDLVTHINLNIEAVRLRQLLETLKVDDAAKITVGVLLAYGVSGSEEAAREMARTRLGKWGAKAGGVSAMITEDDGKMLIKYGATYTEELLR